MCGGGGGGIFPCLEDLEIQLRDCIAKTAFIIINDLQCLWTRRTYVTTSYFPLNIKSRRKGIRGGKEIRAGVQGIPEKQNNTRIK